uniref:ABC transporter permease n=1 Tax=Fervidicoccus fontis TaxID=683846 RepID=A0A7J3ZJE6_9CREN
MPLRSLVRSRGLRSFLSEFKNSKTGTLGLALLVALIFIAIGFPLIGSEEAIRNWSNLEYWQDYPKKQPPCWAARGSFETVVLTSEAQEEGKIIVREFVTPEGLKVASFSVPFRVESRPPTNINLKFRVSYNSTTWVLISLSRPDGLEVYLTSSTIGGANGTTIKSVFGIPSSEYSGPASKQLSAHVSKLRNVEAYLKPWLESLGLKIESAHISMLAQSAFDLLFRKASLNMLTERDYLRGVYNLTIAFASEDSNLRAQVEKIVLVGGCYGLMGTDSYGRDLLQGVLYGVRWALVIGLLVSFASVVLGGVYGVVSGYVGGIVDEVMLRVAQVFYSIPVLPLLILLSAILKPSIWNLVLLLIVFGWPGTALVTRSMALQLKEETYVEAARALGAGHARIVVFYILPQVLPYLFASIALSVPNAVLTEAGVSFLGLTDPSVVTWGRILNEAEAAAATINGYWWWVIPPGVMITIVGATFIFIGQALDTILNPRLKR